MINWWKDRMKRVMCENKMIKRKYEQNNEHAG